MNREELRAYLEAQIAEINKYKWLESERQKCDIGFERAAFEWIHQYGEAFRQGWFSNRHITVV